MNLLLTRPITACSCKKSFVHDFVANPPLVGQRLRVVQSARKMLAKIVGFVGVFFTVSSAIVTFYEFTTKGKIEGAANLAVHYFFALFVLSILYLFVQDYRLGRKARYAEVLGRISALYERIQDAVLESAITDAPGIRGICEYALNELSGIFDTLTSTKTATCIKLILTKYRDETHCMETIVVTLSRDSASGKTRIEEDKKQHWLSDNTGFQSVWINKGAPFFCNDLPAFAGYANTSAAGVSPWRVPPRGVRILRKWFASWPLKYRSTIIVAISSPSEGNYDHIHGFLCVDSRSRGVFDERYGVDILSGFSRVLSPLIVQYHKLASSQPSA